VGEAAAMAEAATFIARNTNVFTTFDNCIARAGGRSAVSDCIARFANDVRP
jgi:hypothetical protein